MLDSYTICIAVPSLGDTTQTFVRAHISRLPYRIILLQGTPPIRSRAGKLVTGLPGALGLLLRTLAARLPSCLRIKRTAPGLAAYLRKSKVSVVLAQFGLAGIEMMGVCKVARIPLVVHFHGYDAYQRSVVRDHQEAYRTMFSTAFAVVAVSEHMCRQLVSLGAPSHKVKQITYGIDLEQFSESRPSENPPHFVAIGRFMEKKAPHLTILAFEQALAKVPDASLALYGEGPLLPYCKHLVRELGLGERITFGGPLDHADVPGVLRNGRAFLQHSITARNGDSEGTPVAILEAQAMGIPVVSTFHGGLPEAVIHTETGFLVKEHDTTNMAKYIVQLASSPELARSLGARARERIGEHFRQEQQIARLAHLLSEAMLQ